MTETNKPQSSRAKRKALQTNTQTLPERIFAVFGNPWFRRGILAAILLVAMYFGYLGWKLSDLQKTQPELHCVAFEGSSPECFARIVANDPTECNSWNMIGMNLYSNTQRVTVGDKKYNRKQAFQQAAECDPEVGMYWFNLAQAANPGEGFKIGGERYDQEKLLIKAVESDDGISDAWNTLAAGRSKSKPYAQVKGEDLGQVQLIMKALDADPENPHVWRNVAALTNPDGTFEWKGVHYDHLAAKDMWQKSTAAKQRAARGEEDEDEQEEDTNNDE